MINFPTKLLVKWVTFQERLCKTIVQECFLHERLSMFRTWFFFNIQIVHTHISIHAKYTRVAPLG